MNQNPLENRLKQEQLLIRVEIATERDWEAYKKIFLEAYTSSDREMLGVTPFIIKKEQARTDQQWKGDVSSDDRFVVLSWGGSEAIGVGSAEKRDDKGSWYIGPDYVKEKFREQDIQKRMILERLNEIRRRGGNKVSLIMKNNNVRSIHNVELFGFKKVNEKSDNEGFLMELDLKKEK